MSKRDRKKERLEWERTYLSEERTLYSKEQTQLNIVGLSIATIGVGLAILKLFPGPFGDFGAALAIIFTIAAIYEGFRYAKLNRFVKKVEDFNQPYFLKLKKDIERASKEK